MSAAKARLFFTGRRSPCVRGCPPGPVSYRRRGSRLRCRFEHKDQARECPVNISPPVINKLLTSTRPAGSAAYSTASRYPTRGWVTINGGSPSASSLARSRRTYTRTYSVSVSYPVPQTRRRRWAWVSELPLVGGQLAQQGELGRGEMDGLAGPGDLLARQVDAQVADGDHGRRCLGRCPTRPGPAQRGGDPGQQLLDAERLGHVVVGADVEGGHLVALASPGRDDDDPDRGALPDQAAQVEPVDLRQLRSSRTMSGSSVSSSWRAREPSVETTVSKPRTTRFERMRSTMLGSSSTRGRGSALRVRHRQLFVHPRPAVSRRVTGLARSCRHRARPPPGAPRATGRMTMQRVPLQPLDLQRATVGVDDALGDRQAETGAGRRTPALAFGGDTFPAATSGRARPRPSSVTEIAAEPGWPRPASRPTRRSGRIVAQRRCRAG